MRLHFLCRWCLLLMVLATAITSFSQTRALIILLDDNTNKVYPLDMSPKILLENGKVIVVCGDMRSEYTPDRIKGVRTGMADVSGINSTYSNQLSIVASGDDVDIVGVYPGDKVTLCDIAGKNLFVGRISGDGTLNIDIRHLVSGTYIIQVGTFSHKFLK